RCALSRRGSLIASCTSSRAATLPSVEISSDHFARPCFSSRTAPNRASAYGRAIVDSSAMTRPVSELCLELFEQLGVCLDVHFAAKDLFGALDGQYRHIGAQRLAHALPFLGGVLLGLCHDAGLFGLTLATRLIDQQRGLLFGFGQTRMVFGLGRG